MLACVLGGLFLDTRIFPSPNFDICNTCIHMLYM